jgi:hypothetical protein
MHGYWGLVPPPLIILRIDSLYLSIGEAVSYKIQTAGVWRLCGFPGFPHYEKAKTLKTHNHAF